MADTVPPPQTPIPVKTSPQPEDRILLEGPHSRLREARLLLKVIADFIAGFRTLHFCGPCVTVFGSARIGDGHPYYQLGIEVGKGLARLGFTVMTGGGPGLMEAANRGAREAGGRSVGVNIVLPFEQAPNRYCDRIVTSRLFLRAQGAAVQVFIRVRRAAGRAGHARRAERSADAHSDEEDPALPRRPDGGDLLAWVSGPARRYGQGRHGERERPEAVPRHRQTSTKRSSTSANTRSRSSS